MKLELEKNLKIKKIIRDYIEKIKHLPKMMESLKNYKSAYICGGAIADAFFGQTPNDIDVYFTDDKELKDFIKKHGTKASFATDNALTFSFEYAAENTIQVVTNKNFSGGGDIYGILHTFDLAMLRVAIKFSDIFKKDDEKVEILSVGESEYYFENKIAFLTLTKYTSPNFQDPIVILKRLFKYQAKGWKIANQSILMVYTLIQNASRFKNAEDMMNRGVSAFYEDAITDDIDFFQDRFCEYIEWNKLILDFQLDE